MEVVSTESNAEVLANVPHKEMEYMSVVNRMLVDEGPAFDDGRATVLVTNNLLMFYHEADETENADQFKFCVLLTEHCAELLLKEILRRNHPALIFENIDKVK